MKIHKLELIHFGKFHNKIIDFDPQVNLIYGANESGKTTIWHFILGMFYGFFKPYIKTRRYLEIHAKYQPWESSKYCGSMILFDENMERTLRIYRNFQQGEEAVTIHDHITGEDLTRLYEIHPVFRLPDIAKMHLKMSYYGYMNMGAVSQLGHETDENLIIELKEMVVNTLSSKTLNVSMHKIQKQLKSKKDEIGSKRKTSSIYAKTAEAIDTLYYQREQLIEQEKDMVADIEDQKTLEKTLELIEEQLKDIQRYEEYLIKSKARERLERIQMIKNKQNIIEENILQIKRNTNYKIEDIYTAKEKYKEKTILENENDKLEQEYQSIQEEEKKIQEEIKKNMSQKEAMDLKEKSGFKKLLVGGSVVASLLFAFFVFTQYWTAVFITTSGLILLIGMIFILQRRSKENHYKIYRIEESNRSLYEQLEQLKDRSDRILLQMRQYHQMKIDLNAYLMPIMELLDINSSQCFEERIQEYRTMEKYQLEHIRLEEQEKGLVENKALIDIQKEVEAYDFDTIEEWLHNINQEQLDKLKKDKSEILHRQEQKKYEYIKVTTQLKEARKKYKSLADIDEKINRHELKLEAYDHQLKVYDIIDSTLEAIAQELKYEFSPSMNRTLSKLIAKVTNGKYTEVKITPDMQILFLDPVIRRLEDISSLSRGTIDLFYIIFRYTIAKWSHQNQSIPFVLDEVFAYVDDQRLKRVVEVLLEFEEQILLFTCQNREKLLAIEKSIKIVEL